jgi:ubiquinone/menaquinone biosynthesis C-methylase UbiE
MPHEGHPHSASSAFFLDNPIRRLLQPASELVNKLSINKNDAVMDFGCGPGYFTVELAKRAHQVIAVDLSAEMLKKAQTKATKADAKNIRFLQSSGTKLELKAALVDLIFLVTVYHEVGDAEAVLKEFGRVLKPSGRLVIVEVVKKGLIPGAPVQDPAKIKAEVTAANFAFQQMLEYRNYGFFFFTKNA